MCCVFYLQSSVDGSVDPENMTTPTTNTVKTPNSCAPPPRPPPPAGMTPTPLSPGGRGKRISQGPQLEAIVESSFNQSQPESEDVIPPLQPPPSQTQSDQTQTNPDSANSEDVFEQDWVLLKQQVSNESGESAKCKHSTSDSQEGVEEAVEALDDLKDTPAESDDMNENSSELKHNESVDVDDIDAIVAEFEALRKQSEAQDAMIETQIGEPQSADEENSNLEVDLQSNGASFQKKPLGFSKSLPASSSYVHPKGQLNNEPRDNTSSPELEIGGTPCHLTTDTPGGNAPHNQSEQSDYSAWDKSVKREGSKKRKASSFFNKWRNKDKHEDKSQQQSDQNLGHNSHSENDLVLMSQTKEEVDQSNGQGEGAIHKKEHGGLMRRMSKMLRKDEDFEDGSGSSTISRTRSEKRKKPEPVKICMIDLTMEEVPKHPPVKKLTYLDHCQMGRCFLP